MASNVTMEELKKLAQQPGVRLTGGGIGYDPNARENQWESRYDNEGNIYNSRITVPMIQGHSRDLETVVPIADIVAAAKKRSKLINEAPWNAKTSAVNPMSLYNRQGRADYTPQNIISDEVIQGDPRLGSLPDPRLAAGAYAEEAYYIEQDRQAKIEAQQGRRADWDMRRADDQFAGLDDEVGTRKMLSDWDVDTQMDTQMSGASDQFDKLDIDWEDRNALRVLQNLRLKEVEAKRQEQFAPADFNPEEFRQRIANRSTPDWLGESEGPMTDATRASDTDDFGNLLSTDAFGQTNYEASINQRLNVLNNQSGGINYKKPVAIQSVQPEPRSNYPKHFTPWMVDQLESQRKRKEMVQGIGDTVTGVYDDVTGFDYKGLGSDIYNKGANAVQGVQDLYTDFNKPGVSTPPVDTRPEYPSHLTSYAIEQLEGQRKRKEFIQGIGNKVSDITESFNAWKNRNFK